MQLALIPLFPLIGFLINGCWYAFGQAPQGKQKAKALIPGVIATGMIFLSFLVSLFCFIQLLDLAPEKRWIEENLFTWIKLGSFQIDLKFKVDSLSTLFTLVITGIGTLIHIYSIGYMSHDATPGKFFAYLNLFCFAMLMLVLGASLPILFFGWEGVGLCSYLLIGYWYEDINKASAGKKAFIVNRVGDLGFLLGMFLIYSTYGTLEFQSLQTAVQNTVISPEIITTICLLLFVGCTGKSAQIPLYVWLPDAMAGPTPVSALIHAATMVTSGIYMISRLNFLYSLSPTALQVIATVGAITAIFAATIALVQKDIKKVLAYSTVSQLGYMFLGCGVGAYSAGVFHVITHAFFKALLFLGAGSVIHGMHEEQDIMKMGGLKLKMPKTFLTFAIGCIAIAGIPPFSGFFSKDEILWQSFSSPHGSTWLWMIGAITAVMTAFYMTRLFSLTFLGQPRFNDGHAHSHPSKTSHHNHHHHNDHHDHGHKHSSESHSIHVHESPSAMVIPLQILAALSIVGGFMGIPHMSWIETWLDPVIPAHHALSGNVMPSMEWILMAMSVLGAIFGIWAGLSFYKTTLKAQNLAHRFSWLHRILENKWYIDEFYQKIILNPIRCLSEFLWKKVDVAIIDRIVLSFGKLTHLTGQVARLMQTGSIQVYAIFILFGLIATAGYLVYVRI